MTDKMGELILEQLFFIQKNMATKEDLKNFATKEDLKNFATKEDLKNFATKQDLADMEKRTDEKLNKLSDEITEEYQSLIRVIDKKLYKIRV